MPFSTAGMNCRGIDSAEDLVDQLELAAARQRLETDLAVAELAVSAGLFLVAAVGFHALRNGFAIRNARRLEQHFDAEAALQLRDRDLDVHLSLAGEQQLVGLRIALVLDGRILFLEPMHRRADLVFIAAALRLDRVGEHRLREGDLLDVRPAAFSASVSLVLVSFNFATAPMSPALNSGTFAGVLPCSAIKWPSRSGAFWVALFTVESAFRHP